MFLNYLKNQFYITSYVITVLKVTCTLNLFKNKYKRNMNIQQQFIGDLDIDHY